MWPSVLWFLVLWVIIRVDGCKVASLMPTRHIQLRDLLAAFTELAELRKHPSTASH